MPQIVVDTAKGRYTITERNGAITRLAWGAGENQGSSPVLERAAAQLVEYFLGERRVFDLPLAPEGTAFQQRAWQALSAIPFGETRSYGELAARIDSVPRAVGGACGANPIPVIIPCHRVLAAQGRPGGYSGKGGLVTKGILLAHEAKLAGRP